MLLSTEISGTLSSINKVGGTRSVSPDVDHSTLFMPRIFCLICGKTPSADNCERPEHWSSLAADLFLARKARDRNAVCGPCSGQLRNPYSIYDRKTKVFLRALHTTSRQIRVNRRTIKGLLALDPIPEGVAFPYPGLLLDAITLDRIEKEGGFTFTRAYAKGGPKDRGLQTVLLGHLTRAGPLYCAHYVNCCYKTKLRHNAIWGIMRVDRDFLGRYPGIPARIGDRYPAIRTTKAIASGEEVLLKSYGASYWLHAKKEQRDDNVVEVRSVPPPLKRKLEDLQHSASRSAKRQRLDLEKTI